MHILVSKAPTLCVASSKRRAGNRPNACRPTVVGVALDNVWTGMAERHLQPTTAAKYGEENPVG